MELRSYTFIIPSALQLLSDMCGKIAHDAADHSLHSYVIIIIIKKSELIKPQMLQTNSYCLIHNFFHVGKLKTAQWHIAIGVFTKIPERGYMKDAAPKS